MTKILKATSQGKPVYVVIVSIAKEMTTQASAQILGCSGPHLIELLEEGKIPFTKIGKHRWLRYEYVASFKNKMKEGQKSYLINMMGAYEE